MAVLAIFLIPSLVLLLIEAGLRLAGFGYPTGFFVPASDGNFLTTNRRFAWQFYNPASATQPNPILMRKTKDNQIVRIFVLGESAAAGTPDPSFGFARVLEVMLESAFPNRRFEIVNAAMRGINSHIILPIARECARHQPDLFLVYMGNNETIGLHAPNPDGLNLTPHLRFLRSLQAVKSTKTAQWIQLKLQKTGANAKAVQDMDYFRKHRLAPGHARKRAVYSNFEANLTDICAAIAQSGAKAIVSTVAVNLRDFPPLASVHSPAFSKSQLEQWEAAYRAGNTAEDQNDHAAALAQYRKAEAIDPAFADLHFRIGRCCFRVGQFAQGKKHFEQARDLDAMQFRTDSQINQITRALAQSRPSFFFLDAEAAFAASASSEHGVPGQKLFHEHVHFTFEGDYLLAQSFFPVVVQALELGSPVAPLPSRAECANRLGFTDWDEINVASAMAELLSKPPFLDQLDHGARQAQLEKSIQQRLANLTQADLDRFVAVYEQALARRPDDWQLHFNFASLRVAMKDLGLAATEFGHAARLFPDNVAIRLMHAKTLGELGKWDQAAAEFAHARRLAPDSATVASGLDWARNRGR